MWGTDAHAKNYSLILSEGTVRLAPLYDVASYLPYATTGPDAKPVRLPMHIGGEYRIRAIRRSHWELLADKTGLDREQVCGWARESSPQLRRRSRKR
ncbi:HipA domain-containing protein [Pseudarthrobacter albicanus]|uniref:HipA domain-containing protein n=1 Tax=Pseudarthrobacter albicanus TaxID=2823873 RepID=UPI001BAE19C9|nr:HipA domain-containing protein [Pseudarthrobacter albicanus]